MQVGAGGAVEVDCAGMQAVAVSAHCLLRAHAHGSLRARAHCATATSVEHQVAAVGACGRGSGLVMCKCWFNHGIVHKLY